MTCIRLEIESDLPSVSLMAMAVGRICAFYGMNEVESYEVELCVAEAATNAILHAYNGSPGKQVSLILSVEAGGLRLECRDTGKSMGPEHIRKLSIAPVGEEAEALLMREGGRGLLIISGIMDEVTYTTLNNVNRLTMLKRLNRSLISREGR